MMSAPKKMKITIPGTPGNPSKSFYGNKLSLALMRDAKNLNNLDFSDLILTNMVWIGADVSGSDFRYCEYDRKALLKSANLDGIIV